MASLPFVGLTGGMGAGKSEALRALERLGAATLSSDAVVHELLESDEVRGLLAERFGADVAADRAAIAGVVFADPGERAWLEGVLWPRVGARIASWREELGARETAPRAAVVEVPLLFESGMEAAFDHTIAVVAGDAVRASRTSGRDHAATDERDARQLSQAEKADRAEFAVRNDGTLAELERELSRILETIST
ncbi:MAG: dephospho-CoA kinase [Thermoleophilaceae bacterium]